jgi:hypothetical protein
MKICGLSLYKQKNILKNILRFSSYFWNSEYSINADALCMPAIRYVKFQSERWPLVWRSRELGAALRQERGISWQTALQ